jgi:hypothetical protein
MNRDRDWEGPTWAQAPMGYDPRDHEPDLRPRAPWTNRLGRRWVRLRRKMALLCVRLADKLQPDEWKE